MAVLSSTGFQLFSNPRTTRDAPYSADGRSAILSHSALEKAKREITAWTGYHRTPLRELSGLAKTLGIGQIFYKDEAERFGLGSFKALGGAYAVFRLLQQEIRQRHGQEASARDILSGRIASTTSELTVTCATDGNHGRSVAWGARTFGCRCVIYVPETVSEGRCQAISSYGAEVRRVPGNYDDVVRQAAADAAANGWHVVSDTSYDGYTEIPRDVMQGYSLMVEEALDQAGHTPTHVFVQGGVGGLAAAACAYLWERLGAQRPTFVVVEPDKADCLYRSAVAGRPTAVTGALDTIMAGLACGEVSLLAWQILQPGANAFITIGDEAAAQTMRLLAESPYGDAPIVAGESAVAGLSGLIIASSDQDARAKLSLRSDSVALVFGTEGATDPEVYHRIVGRSAEDVNRMRAT
jgi:diaminopropionate ammonia-lyase